MILQSCAGACYNAKAEIAKGSEDDALRNATSALATHITDYKKAAKHARKMKPNAKPKAKAKAAPDA